MPASRRLLLVEFVNADQFPGRISYNLPFLSGFYRAQGMPTRWIRFGISTTNLMQHGRDQITLTEAELDRLLDVVREHQPTQLVLTDEIYDVQLDAVRALIPKLRVIPAKDPGWWKRLGNSWAGVNNVLLAGVSPHYAWEPGNEAATTRKIDNIYLVQAESCGHRCAISDNPTYEGVGDKKAQDHMGCAFCQNWLGRKRKLPWWERVPSPFQQTLIEETPDEWIDRQLEAIASTRGDRIGLPNGVLLEQLLSTRIFRRCLETMQRLGMVDDVKLLIAVRAAQSPAVGRLLDEHFERHRDSKLEVGVYASGIESFDDRDLQLLNKGTRPLDGLRTVNTFRALKARSPGQFWFTGLSFILFTPWTTLEGLHLNVGLIRALGLTRKVAGNMFQSRLRLHPELPITLLAQRDGLLVEDETDPVMVMNRRKLFGSERAWRFADPRVRPVSRVVLRFDLLDDDAGDELTSQLRAGLLAVNPRWSSGDDADLQEVMLALIEEALAEPEVLAEEELVRRALARWRSLRERRSGAPPADRYRIGERRVDLGELAAALGGLVEAGQVEVATVRGATGTELDEEARSALAQRGIHHLLVDDDGRETSRSGTLLLARDRQTLDRRAALQAALLGGDAEARREAGAAAARLQGAPPCCAQAAADDPNFDPRLPVWAALRRRAERPGAAPAGLAPCLVPSLGFAPCRVDCGAATERFRAWHAALGLEPPPDDAPRAWLYALDGPGDGELVTLTPTFPDEETITWSAEIPAGPGELRARLRAADTLRLVPGQIRFYRDGRVVDVATLDYAVWATDRCWHPKETLELATAASQILDGAAARDHIGTPEALDAAARRADIGSSADAATARDDLRSPGEASGAAGERATALRSLAEAIIARYADRFGGVTVDRIGQAREGGPIELLLCVDGQPYQLSLADPGGGARYMFRTDGFAVSHAAPTPLTSEAHRHTVKAWVEVLDRAVRSYAPQLLPGAPSDAAQPARGRAVAAEIG